MSCGGVIQPAAPSDFSSRKAVLAVTGSIGQMQLHAYNTFKTPKAHLSQLKAINHAPFTPFEAT